jgi:hypothetical protein
VPDHRAFTKVWCDHGCKPPPYSHHQSARIGPWSNGGGIAQGSRRVDRFRAPDCP